MANVRLTKHENATFLDQTVYVTGHAHIQCAFERCTLVFTGQPFALKGCRFRNCNWRIEHDVLWGDPATRSCVRQLLDLIDGAPDGSV